MTDKMPEKILKPCPFCGGKAAYAKKYAYCTKCAASCGYSDEDLEMIAAAWNTRSLTSTVTAELDLANKACEAVTEVLKEKLAQWATEKKNLERRITERNTALAKYQARLDADAAKLEAAEKMAEALDSIEGVVTNDPILIGMQRIANRALKNWQRVKDV